MLVRLLFGRRGPAPVRDPRPAPRRRLSAWLSGSTRKGSARTARSWSRTATILEAAIELPGLRAGSGRRGAADQASPGIAHARRRQRGDRLAAARRHRRRRASVRKSSARRSPSAAGPSRPRLRPTDLPAPRRADACGSGSASRAPHRRGRDPFEEAGWSELLEEAASGEIAFEGGALRMSLTPAMTLFDVDGGLPPAALAEAGAAAAARAIRRFGIAGSIGIDLPTLPREPSGRPPPQRSTRSCRSRSSGPRSTASASCRSSGDASGRRCPSSSRPIRPARAARALLRAGRATDRAGDRSMPRPP